MRIVLTSILLACSAGQATAAAPDQHAVARLVEAYRAREHVKGIAIVVLGGDRVLLRQGYGDTAPGQAISAEAIQPYYSISKQVTAALVLQLAARGRLKLDDPVGKHLPRWFSDEPGLRVRHLLSQTSGLAEFTASPEAHALDQSRPGLESLDPVLDLIDSQSRRFRPGERHGYSNSNYTVLATLAETADGRLFNAALEAMLAKAGLPGIRPCAYLARAAIATGYDAAGNPVGLPPNVHLTYAGNGGLCGSADALAAWTHALHTGRIVPASLLREMGRGRRTASGYTPPYGFGLSTLRLAGHAAYSHAGVDAGWTAWTAYLPNERLTIAILANRGWLFLTDLGLPLVRLLTGMPDPPPLQRLPLTPEERTRLRGVFEDGLFDLTLDNDADAVTLRNPAFAEPIEFWKQANGRFVSPRRPDSFVLQIGDEGIVFDWAEHRSYLVPRLAEPVRAR